MNPIKRIGTILTALSLAIMSGCWVADLNSLYYGGGISLAEQSNHSIYLAFMYNRETQIVMDLTTDSNVEFTMLNSEQIRTLLSQGITTYFMQSTIRGGLNKTLGAIDQGFYILIFNSTDKNQVVNMKVIQKGPEYGLIALGMILLLFGAFLIASSLAFDKLLRLRRV
ncbi:MAG: hypothetical protein QW304_02325 [Thermoproteota archaeon]